MAALLVAIVAGAAGWYVGSTRAPEDQRLPSTPILAADWRGFTAPDGSFSIDMPGDVRSVTDERTIGGASRAITSHIGTKGNVSLFVSVYPTFGITNDDDLVQQVAQSLADNAGGTVENTSRHAGQDPLADYTITVPGGTLKSAAFLRQGVAYVIGFNAPTIDAGAFERFQGSFRSPATSTPATAPAGTARR